MGAASVLLVAGVGLLSSSPASAFPGNGTTTVTTTASPSSPVVVDATVTITTTVTNPSPSGTPGGSVTFEYSTDGTTYYSRYWMHEPWDSHERLGILRDVDASSGNR